MTTHLPAHASLVVETPAYMSPEEAAGSQEVDGRTDIYSLGCVVYEVLAGAGKNLAGHFGLDFPVQELAPDRITDYVRLRREGQITGERCARRLEKPDWAAGTLVGW